MNNSNSPTTIYQFNSDTISKHDSSAVIPQKEKILKNLSSIIFSCTQNSDNPDYGLFKGCLDWHSCVHGFWAIFRISLTLSDDEEVNSKAKEIFKLIDNDDNISQEVNLLRNDVEFEFPYGRAWLLRLSVDYKEWCKRSSLYSNMLFCEFCEEVAINLLDRIIIANDKQDSHITEEYSNIPWVCVQLFDYFNYNNDIENINKVREFVIMNYLKNIHITLSDDLGNDGFFSLAGNVVLCVIKILLVDEVNLFFELNPEIFNYTHPLNNIENVHQLGLNWSRAWCLKIFGLDNEFLDHVREGWIVHEKIVKEKKFGEYDSYYAYDHWVPQFIVYALTVN